MYKNPIFGDIIPQKTINSYSNIIFFQNSLKYSKYASISPTIFLQKIHPLLPVSPSSCYGSVENYWEIDCALLPNREWNQKQKPKKTALEQRGMLRIWRCDCALCVIGNEFPCRQPHNPSATLLRGLSTLHQG